MKAGWELKALGDFSEVKYGYTAKAQSDPVGPSFLRITDIQKGAVDWSKVPYCKVSLNDQEKHRLLSGDLVFARTGATTGKSFLIHQPPEAVCASYLIRLRPDPVVALPKHLNYYFQTSEYWEEVESGTEGAAQGGFNATKLSALKIPLPPLEEQKRIVSILDEAFEGLDRARENAKANLKSARELFDATLQSTLDPKGKIGWGIKSLGDVCDFKGGSQPPKSEFINEPKTGYVRMLQIRDFKSDDKAVYIPITDKTNQCAETDIMIGRYGASVGQIHRGKSGAYNVALIRTIPEKKHVHQDYLYHYLTSDLFQKPLMSVSKRGAQDGFSKPDIAPFQIPLPPLAEQKRIVFRLDKISMEYNSLKVHYRAKLQDISDLRQSLLQKAFAGELT